MGDMLQSKNNLLNSKRYQIAIVAETIKPPLTLLNILPTDLEAEMLLNIPLEIRIRKLLTRNTTQVPPNHLAPDLEESLERGERRRELPSKTDLMK
jgi:hypothetical protein